MSAADDLRSTADWIRTIVPHGSLHRDRVLAAAERIGALELAEDRDRRRQGTDMYYPDEQPQR